MDPVSSNVDQISSSFDLVKSTADAISCLEYGDFGTRLQEDIGTSQACNAAPNDRYMRRSRDLYTHHEGLSDVNPEFEGELRMANTSWRLTEVPAR
jgi:hypothetical protein